MVRVVGVRFRRAGKIYYFDPGDLPLRRGMHVIVETSRGMEYGEVALPPRFVEEDEVVGELKPIVRVATPEDDRRMEENRRRQEEAFRICLEKIDAHGLPMNLVDAEYTFDGSKLVFSFTAEGRVDFRQLVRDLAAVFRTRIELRQIGVRDEAKLLGGIGPCGRVLCCSSFLSDFAPVSIRMAKDQNLSLNPTKISGLCGRLMCCLRYEQGHYGPARPAVSTEDLLTAAQAEPAGVPAELEQEPDLVLAGADEGEGPLLDLLAAEEVSAGEEVEAAHPAPAPGAGRRRRRRRGGRGRRSEPGQPPAAGPAGS
ncbi:PSP1 domain-containing protein [Caldinitratiruptor microaerophilus]|uniref:PSP1 C-terminal domain-containing protein n=1 Tax=Caldinitratiruptor microaerophilus TaxID=671077 RepID=A0AA35G9B3_9FIRM|nr:stage 0 sporulation family protein [Caldinitratiruptor microaerophilus]BDG61985.1 hypothetical protein caldi_30750 [Caldinitratiruptor microaerophilus]